MDRASLKDRTIKRGEAVWQDYDLDNLTEGTARVEGQIDQLGRDTIRQGIAIVDGAAEFEAEQRDKLFDLQMDGVEQDRRLAYEKYRTQLQVLAYKIAGEMAILASKEYDVQVQAYIMTAKEFAAEVEREQIALQKSRALMDMKKEEAHLKRTESEILLEYVNRQQVAVDIAKARLQAAQAVVRAVTTQVEAEQMELRVVQADLDIVMAEVERATLLADIALIFADIIVRGLAKIKLEVETAEIAAAFLSIQSKLDDMLAIWADRKTLEEVREQYEKLFLVEVQKQLPLQKKAEDLRLVQQDREVETFFFEKDKVDGSGPMESNVIEQMRPGGISDEDWDVLLTALKGRKYTGKGIPIAECEKELRDIQQEAKEQLVELKYNGEMIIRHMSGFVEKLLSAAHAGVAAYTEITEVEHRLFSQRIHKGYFAVPAPEPPPPPPPDEPPDSDLKPFQVQDPPC